MKISVDFIPGGGVTSPRGFLAGAISAGIKYVNPGRLDLGILFSDSLCNAAAVFTRNKVQAAPVKRVWLMLLRWPKWRRGVSG